MNPTQSSFPEEHRASQQLTTTHTINVHSMGHITEMLKVLGAQGREWGTPPGVQGGNMKQIPAKATLKASLGGASW